MISDERLYKIDELVRASLNDEAAPAMVCYLLYTPLYRYVTDRQGGLNAVYARVYAVKVKPD